MRTDCDSFLGVICLDLLRVKNRLLESVRDGRKRGAQALHLPWQVCIAPSFSVALCKLLPGRRPLPPASERVQFLYLPVSSVAGNFSATAAAVQMQQFLPFEEAALKWLRSSQKRQWLRKLNLKSGLELFFSWSVGLEERPQFQAKVAVLSVSTVSCHHISNHRSFHPHVVVSLTAQSGILRLRRPEVSSTVGHIK